MTVNETPSQGHTGLPCPLLEEYKQTPGGASEMNPHRENEDLFALGKDIGKDFVNGDEL